MGRRGRPAPSAAYSVVMRFERIFDDLEGQFAHHRQEEVRAVSEELTRAEQAQLTLADRLRGAEDQRVTLHLGPALRVAGTVQDVGAGWVSLAGEGGRLRAVTPLAAIALMEGLPSRALPMGDAVLSPLGLGSILREIARDRSVVRVETAAGGVIGRIAAVGADTLDVRTLPTGEPTPVPGSARITVSTAALLAVLLN